MNRRDFVKLTPRGGGETPIFVRIESIQAFGPGPTVFVTDHRIECAEAPTEIMYLLEQADNFGSQDSRAILDPGHFVTDPGECDRPFDRQDLEALRERFEAAPLRGELREAAAQVAGALRTWFDVCDRLLGPGMDSSA